MIIKRTINFYPNKGKAKGDGNAPLRCYIRYNNISVTINLGYNVNINGWNADTQRCKKNTAHDAQNIPAAYINKQINACEEIINNCFEVFEQKEQVPTKDELKELIDIRTGKKKENNKNADNFIAFFDEYIRQAHQIEKWTRGTEKSKSVTRNHLHKFKPNLSIYDFDDVSFPEKLISYYLAEGISNLTLQKQFSIIKAVLRWAIRKRIIDKSYFLNYKLELKTARKQIIFLTWEELMKVYNFDFSSRPHLGAVRDVFCFCCFTSLRYSDVANLKKENITNDTIHFTTIKTADTLEIELNKYSRSILDKYKDSTFSLGRVLPVISNQKMNDYLKEMAEICGIDTPITTTSYKGSKRIETIIPKYELISTHAGRRTFISNAIMLGIPPEIVMKWSGHSDYKAMKPYIEIANEAKKQAMSIFDKL